MNFPPRTTALIAAALLFALLFGSCAMNTNQQLDNAISAILEPYGDSVHVSVAVRDLESGLVYERDADRVYHAASTMKVPVLIELFRQASQGRFEVDDSLTVDTRFRSIADSSTFVLDRTTDSDQKLYAWEGKKMAIIDLAHRMINVSSNLATNLLIERVGADSVQQTIERLGVRHMRVLRGVEDIQAFRRGMNNTATARDLAVLLEKLAQGEAVSPERDRIMLAIMEEQQFNDMIPAGLPDDVRVAHKTGSITGIHHDAAVVLFQERAPLVLVILTEGFDDKTNSAEVGADIARAVYRETVDS